MTILTIALAFLAAQDAPEFKDKILAKVPEDVTLIRAVFNSVGTKVAYTVRKGSKFMVGINGKLGPEYDALGIEPYLSADGLHVAYTGRSGQTWNVVFDGGVVGSSTQIGTVSISAVGGKWAYSVTIPQGAQVNHNTRLSETFTMVGPPTFAPKGTGMAYMARVRRPIPPFIISKDVMVINDKQGADYEVVGGDPLWSPDGRQVAYRARQATDWCVVTGEQRGSMFEDVQDLVWGGDSKMLLYRGQRDGAWHLIVNGQKSAAYEELSAPVFSPDGKRFGCGARKEGKAFLMIDGREVVGEGRVWDTVTDIAFSENDKVIAYRALKGAKWRVVKGDVAGPEWETVGPPAMNADGSVGAYRATQAHYQMIIVNDAPVGRYIKVGEPVVSRQGKVAFQSYDHASKWTLRAALEYSHPPCDEMYGKPLWNSAGTKVATGALRNRDLIWIVLGAESKPQTGTTVTEPPK